MKPETTEKQPQGKMGQILGKLRGINKTVVFGAVVTIFALIGLIVSVVFLGGKIGDAFGHEKEKQLYEKILTPVVMLDPVPVENINKLGDEKIVSAAIWSLILNENKDEYQHDDYSVYIPAADVDHYAKQLFGNEIQFNNVSISDSEYTFEYLSESKTYSVPIEIQYMPYRPEIDKISKNGDKVTLKVGYLSRSSVWGMHLKGGYDEKPFKYVEYELTRTGRDQYYISGIHELSDNGITSSSSSGVSSATSSSAPVSSGTDSDPETSSTTDPTSEPQSQTPTDAPVDSSVPTEEAEVS